jgi:tRNA pseudouridine38-40 synthase
MEQNFKIVIEYDGTGYHGWQRQTDDRTIQETIEKAIKKMTSSDVTVIGSGRTDAGVHAMGQVANFKCRTDIDTDSFQRGLNSILPDDIVIKSCQTVDDAFHARYNAKFKVYRYVIWNQDAAKAIGRQYAWHVKKKLDLKTMEKAVQFIIGEHDFKAFEAVGSPRSHTRREVVEARLHRPENSSDQIVFTIQANGFLRYMVRNIVGTLVAVGLGKITAEAFRQIMLSHDRNNAAATAPAKGLFLMEVKY